MSEFDLVSAIAEGRLEDAKVHLLVEIAVAKAAGSAAMLAGLAQKLGTIAFKQGDKASAIAIYEFSENLDPGSLLAKLQYARFLLQEANDPQAAASKTQALLALIETAPFAETEDDFSSERITVEAACELSEFFTS